MVVEILKSIIEAEAKASDVLRDAEKQVRKIDERNYADIQKLRDDMNSETGKAIRKLEQEVLGNPSADITASISTPTNQKIQDAKAFIVNSIIRGAV